MLTGPTVAEVLASVQDLGYGTDTQASQIRMVADAQRRILSQWPWLFLGAQATNLVTTAGVASVALSTADLVHVDAVRLAAGTDRIDPEAVDLERLRAARHSDTAPAAPVWWAQANDTIEFYPIPDKVYALTVDYTKMPAVPTATTDVLLIPSAHIDVIVYAVAKRLAARQRDWNAVASHNAEYVQALKEMKGAYNIDQRQDSDRVGSSSWWDGVDR